MISSIENLIYVEILKIPLAQVSQYFSAYDRLIHLLLLPSIVILIFMYGATEFLAGKKGLRFLVAIGGIIFSISIGWYGLFVVMSEMWYLILLVVSGFFFILGRIIHPSDVRNLTSISTNDYGRRKIERIDARINSIDSRISGLQSNLSLKQSNINNARNNLAMARNQAVRNTLNNDIRRLENEKRAIENEIHKLDAERAKLLRMRY